MVCVKEEVTRRVKKISGNASSLYVIAVAVRGNDAAFAGAGKREDSLRLPSHIVWSGEARRPSCVGGCARSLSHPATRTHIYRRAMCVRALYLMI